MLANTKAFSGFAVAGCGGGADLLRRDARAADVQHYGLLTLHLAGGRDTMSTRSPTTRRRPTRS